MQARQCTYRKRNDNCNRNGNQSGNLHRKGKVKYTARFTNTAFGVQYREVDIDLVEHKFGEWIDEIPATTENFGTKGHKDCTVCKKHFDKDGNEITDLRIAKSARIPSP